MENAIDVPRWYVISTKGKEEERVSRNLTAWGIETFSPKIKRRQLNQFTGKAVYFSHALFPRYIFARFDVDSMLHKIRYTRGVQKVVSFNHTPAPVDDEIIVLIHSKVAEDGFVQLDDKLRRGDEVSVSDGTMRGISGIFDRTTKDKSRVMILLTAINYQASLVVERDSVRKTQSPNYKT